MKAKVKGIKGLRVKVYMAWWWPLYAHGVNTICWLFTRGAGRVLAQQGGTLQAL